MVAELVKEFSALYGTPATDPYLESDVLSP
jgi:hypothetical protein